jgi:hypothetical protein
MPLKRPATKVTERTGVNYVRTLVENANSVFNEIDQGNDLGIDCYIDFTIDNNTTGFSICAQIKSGDSYKDKSGYKIPADRAHMERWAESLLPVVGLVYDPSEGCAFWISISDYLRDNPHLLNSKSHTIRVSKDNKLNTSTFLSFRTNQISRITEYKSYENFGRSLDEFSCFNNPSKCYNGLKALFSNHGDRYAAWLYITMGLEYVCEEGIQVNILGMVSNFVIEDVLWDSRKGEFTRYQKSMLREEVLRTISKHFTSNSVKIAITFLRYGINRGSLSHRIFLLLDKIGGIDDIVYSLADNNNIPLEDRQHLYWLYAHFAQHRSKEKALMRIRQFISDFGDEDGILLGTIETIEQQRFIPTG